MRLRLVRRVAQIEEQLDMLARDLTGLRAGVPLLRRQRLDDLADTLAHLKKNVRDGLEDGGDASMEPRCHHSVFAIFSGSS